MSDLPVMEFAFPGPLRDQAVIELTDVRVVRLTEVDLRHAVDEGEGDETVAQWRANHEKFWHSAEVRAEMGADFRVHDGLLPRTRQPHEQLQRRVTVVPRQYGVHVRGAG
jgi:hypothetical protein